MKHYLIYKTTNKINNMIYVGCHITENINDDYLGSGRYLKRAIEKYGKENFEREILFECQNETEMYLKEKEIIDEIFVARLDTYNLTLGGESGGFYYINKNGFNKQNGILGGAAYKEKIENDLDFREEVSAKLSNSLKLYHEINENAFKGKRHTEESKRKIGEANSIKQKGVNNSNYGNIWITNGNKSKLIKKEEKIPEGWYKGRKIK